MNKEQVFAQLFEREQGSGQLQNERFQEPTRDWRNAKRDLAIEDVLYDEPATTWIKSCSQGYITELTFFPDGRLEEHRLFDRLHTSGKWQLVDGILQLAICKAENTYTMNVVGNAKKNIHSAIEYKNGELHAYLKLAQVRQ